MCSEGNRQEAKIETNKGGLASDREDMEDLSEEWHWGWDLKDEKEVGK